MRHVTTYMLALATLAGCAGSAPDPVSPALSSPDAFVGAWESTTPSLEFLRLSVSSLSSEQGALGARLTFSGVAWEGRGRIDGDSLVASMTMAGSTQASGIIVARVRSGGALVVSVRPISAAALDVSFVRQD
ncbi:MAG: hypothetical protein ABIY52_17125 [Gemmatimonadaceae bacterium]